MEVQQHRNQDILDVQVRIDELEAHKKHLIEVEQKTCKHPQVVECDYFPSDYWGASPPLRLCLNCDFEEEGWDCGYEVLLGAGHWRLTNPRSKIAREASTRTITIVERQELYSLRL